MKQHIKFLNNFTQLLSLLIISILLSGCGTSRHLASDREHPYFQPLESHNYGFTNEYPKSFTIYPFKNTSWIKNAGLRARNNTYQAFSLLGSCTPLQDTDKLTDIPFTSVDALKVARDEGTDAVIIGEVLVQDHTWLGVLEYQYVELKLDMYDTRDGKLLWNGRGVAYDTQAGFIVLINPIIDYAQHGAWSRTTMSLYHRINIDFVHALNPNVLPVK